jgi:hypothetical protein
LHAGHNTPNTPRWAQGRPNLRQRVIAPFMLVYLLAVWSMIDVCTCAMQVLMMCVDLTTRTSLYILLLSWLLYVLGKCPCCTLRPWDFSSTYFLTSQYSRLLSFQACYTRCSPWADKGLSANFKFMGVVLST